MEFIRDEEGAEKYDKALLRFANYLYNNRHSEEKSPHYAEIIGVINKIDSRFMDIASQFRGLANRSPVLSIFNLSTKHKLVDLMKTYSEEVYQGSQPYSKSQEKAYDFSDFESEFEELVRPIAPEDKWFLLKTEEGSTDSELSDSLSDREIERMGSRSTDKVQQLSRENISQGLSPDLESRENIVGLLIKFIQSNKASPKEYYANEFRLIMSTIKVLLSTSTFLPEFAKSEPINVISLTEKELASLYNIAVVYKPTLKQFQEELELEQIRRLDH